MSGRRGVPGNAAAARTIRSRAPAGLDLMGTVLASGSARARVSYPAYGVAEDAGRAEPLPPLERELARNVRAAPGAYNAGKRNFPREGPPRMSPAWAGTRQPPGTPIRSAF